MERDLLSAPTADALRRIGKAASRGARHCAWALEAFDGDEELATAALTDDRQLERARASLRYVTAQGTAAYYAPRWLAEIARLEALLLEKPPSPSIPTDLVTWIHLRLGLTVDDSAETRAARRIGVRGTFIGISRGPHQKLPITALADRIALAYDLFPVGDAWEEIALEEAIHSLSTGLQFDLAYHVRRRAPRSAEHRARRFLTACGSDATIMAKGLELGEHRGWWTPATHSTFERGFAVVGQDRFGVVMLTGED